MSESSKSGIVLLAKQSGQTSFSSLNAIKKALGTKKVGHTGTLDSFAQGLLVVCVGSLTRLVSHITAFDKIYESVIRFGAETDTLDPFGNIIKTAELPCLQTLFTSVQKFTGDIMQLPPLYSAIHVNGERSSDLARQGKIVKLQERPVSIFESKIIQLMFDDGKIFDCAASENFDLKKFFDKRVKYAKIRFFVSKGTYIRCLARDIGKDCGSAAFLAGLLRTQVSCFKLEDACGFELLEEFNIQNVIKNNLQENSKNKKNLEDKKNLSVCFSDFDYLKEKISQNLISMTPSLAFLCGLKTVFLKKEFEFDFFNGKFLKAAMFKNCKFEDDLEYAVFSEKDIFAGVIKCENGKLSYSYVIPNYAC
ncbi:MAG: tRNA pseudouridine(55) synthase TruB [Treponemataceae bacterium]